ncbi:DnaJ-domain-containing protein [Sodiomyces alkalinus F11]|uniref:DnaJ-domain-containing protein n=1 Tax=Sodiomyces alkalinus (strain CBS 110278 / VKM F-3762 / F11) TaxID=1314773 RepID=A0A3N2PRS0_SODAK|nr:DnaJ-domain-containing protein [Sodiomyces alkalinus F11]ROT37212.1 DnaJ-domain-containing protein [Sodiomyces alkalinus F11]
MASNGPPPNYYAILEIQETATTQQVRDAYKKAALKTHPDRVPGDSPERATRTRKFQLVNDAYYTLSDTSRRQEYDLQRKMYGTSSSTSDPFEEADGPSAEQGEGAAAGTGAQNAFSWAWNFFAGQGQAGGGGGGAPDEETRRQTEEQQFGDAFEEMLREEGMAEDGTGRPTRSFWSLVGGASGGALGFIVANVPGLVAGAVAGNRLGAIRDAKGKSVYAVFQVSANVRISAG